MTQSQQKSNSTKNTTSLTQSPSAKSSQDDDLEIPDSSSDYNLLQQQ